jgi:hypothetical protein
MRGESDLAGITDNKYKIYHLLLHKPAGNEQVIQPGYEIKGSNMLFPFILLYILKSASFY